MHYCAGKSTSIPLSGLNKRIKKDCVPPTKLLSENGFPNWWMTMLSREFEMTGKMRGNRFRR
jgi:hypothetical protein